MKKLSQKSVPYKILQNIEENNLINSGDTVIVALSGGPDSVCLFDLLFKLKEKLGIKLLACHYNHRLRGEDSYNDEEFVRKICAERGAECIVGSAAGKNLYKNEESARVARYAFFEKILGERRGAKIAIAHNKNDLAETLLMRLFRGSGILGLKSIPSVRENFIRPLLPISRFEIENYLKHEKLPFRLDKTNKNLNITRNFLRLKVLPLLIKRINPNLIDTLYNTAKLMEDDYNFLDQSASKSYQKVMIKEDKKTVLLDRKKWLLLPYSMQRMVIRKAIEGSVGLNDITNKQIFEVCEVMAKGVGKKYKLLPHSLRIELTSGKISITKIRNN